MTRRQHHEPTKRCLDLDLNWPELGSTSAPGAQAFNAFFGQQPKEACPGGVDLGTGEAEESPGQERLAFSILWATRRYVTVQRQHDAYGTGAAHPNTEVSTRTFDLERRMVIELDELLVRDPGARRRLAGLVLRHLDPAVLAGLWDDRPPLDVVFAALFDARLWALDGLGVTVTFPAYSIGPHSLGMPEVRLSWADLRPWLRPDGPLEPARAAAEGRRRRRGSSKHRQRPATRSAR